MQPVPADRPGAVSIWFSADVEVPREHPLLSDQDRARLDGLLRGEDRARFGTGRVLARLLAGQRAGLPPAAVTLHVRCARCGGAHGKPRLPADMGLELSIAHSLRRVVVAMSSGAAVGVDVEPVRDPWSIPRLAEHLLAAEERRELDALPAGEQARALLTYWVRKEALVKATGHGLNVPLSSIVVTAPAVPPRLVAWSGAGTAPATVTMTDVAVGPDYLACVAVLSGPLPVSVLDATAVVRAAVGEAGDSAPAAPGAGRPGT